MAVDIEAKHALGEVDYLTLDAIYELGQAESEYLSHFQHEVGRGNDFRLFATGYKLEVWQNDEGESSHWYDRFIHINAYPRSSSRG